MTPAAVFLVAVAAISVAPFIDAPALFLTGVGVVIFIINRATITWLNENGHTKMITETKSRRRTDEHHRPGCLCRPWRCPVNAVEKIEAAIEKLERLKAESTPGPWEQFQYDWRMIIAGQPADDEADVLFDRAAARPADMQMIVTLHRTIDAQLAILYRGLSRIAPEHDAAEMLADAILGES